MTMLDPQRKALVHGGRACPLTRMQYRMVAFLALHPGWIRRREEIMNAMGIQENTADRAVDVHVKKLRAALAEVFGPQARGWIRARSGWGYCWDGPGTGQGAEP